MFLDALLLVSDAQAVTATANSTNVIDLGASIPKRQVGESDLGFGVAIDVGGDFTTGNETYAVSVVQSANADLSAPDVLATVTRTATQLAAGALLFVDLPKGNPTKRYVGLVYTVGGTTPTITITAWLTHRDLFSVVHTNYAHGYQN